MNNPNPYQTPQGNLDSNDFSDEGYSDNKFFAIQGIRIGRIRYLAHLALISIAMYAAVLPGAFLAISGGTAVAVAVSIMILFAYIAVIWAMCAAIVQRLHDVNKSGWLALLMLIPLVNLFFGLYITFARGTDGANNYGKPPQPNKTWHWILGLLFPVLSILGILAAVALPAYQDYTKRAADAASSFPMQ